MSITKFLCAFGSYSPLYGLEAVRARIKELHRTLTKQKGNARGQITTVHSIEHFDKVADEMIKARQACGGAAQALT